MEQTHQQQYAAGHECGHNQTGEAVKLNDVVDDDDERARRTAYLYGVAAEGADNETADHGRYESHGGTHAAGDGEGDGQRKGHDAHYYTRNQILAELLEAVVSTCRDEGRMKIQMSCFHKCLFRGESPNRYNNLWLPSYYLTLIV